MLLASLHARHRHGPDLFLEIDLVPPRAYHLAGPRRGQDQELECPRCDALLLMQLRHEGRDIVIRQRGMMLDLANLATGRQQLIEMAAPARRILAFAIGAHRGPVEDRLDTGLGAGIEGYRLRGYELRLIALRFASFDRVDPVEPQAAAVGCPGACLRK